MSFAAQLEEGLKSVWLAGKKGEEVAGWIIPKLRPKPVGGGTKSHYLSLGEDADPGDEGSLDAGRRRHIVKLAVAILRKGHVPEAADWMLGDEIVWQKQAQSAYDWAMDEQPDALDGMTEAEVDGEIAEVLAHTALSFLLDGDEDEAAEAAEHVESRVLAFAERRWRGEAIDAAFAAAVSAHPEVGAGALSGPGAIGRTYDGTMTGFVAPQEMGGSDPDLGSERTVPPDEAAATTPGKPRETPIASPAGNAKRAASALGEATGDPRWIHAKYPGKAEDGTAFKRGDLVLYWPRTKTFMAGDKAEAAWRKFEAEVDDERVYNSTFEDFDADTLVRMAEAYDKMVGDAPNLSREERVDAEAYAELLARRANANSTGKATPIASVRTAAVTEGVSGSLAEALLDERGMRVGVDKSWKKGKMGFGSRNEATLDEVSPPGWAGSVKAMKDKHPEIENPFALAWSMANKGATPHYKDQETSKRGKPVKRPRITVDKSARESIDEAVRPGQVFVIIDKKTGKAVNREIYHGSRKADDALDKMGGERKTGYQVMDAMYHNPSRAALRVMGMGVEEDAHYYEAKNNPELPKWPGASKAYSFLYRVLERLAQKASAGKPVKRFRAGSPARIVKTDEMAEIIDALDDGNEEPVKGLAMKYRTREFYDLEDVNAVFGAVLEECSCNAAIDEGKRAKVPAVGTRVRFEPNPVSLMLYRNPPKRGAEGVVSKMPGIGHYMPGPGGGLVYVKWDHGMSGVSPNDLVTEGIVTEAPEKMFELVYAGGGHGGPYHGELVAKKAAERLLKGGNERWIAVVEYSKDRPYRGPRAVAAWVLYKKDGWQKGPRPLPDVSGAAYMASMESVDAADSSLSGLLGAALEAARGISHSTEESLGEGYVKSYRVTVRGDKFKIAKIMGDARIPFVFVREAGVNTVGDVSREHINKLRGLLADNPSLEGRFARNSSSESLGEGVTVDRIDFILDEAEAVRPGGLTEDHGNHYFDGKDYYADTAFLNHIKGVLPGMVLKHVGFGEFELVGPDGEIEFDRMRGKEFPGQSGRSHKLYDNKGGKLIAALIKAMEQKGKSKLVEESPREAARGIDEQGLDPQGPGENRPGDTDIQPAEGGKFNVFRNKAGKWAKVAGPFGSLSQAREAAVRIEKTKAESRSGLLSDALSGAL